jgi:hypothetical protein
MTLLLGRIAWQYQKYRARPRSCSQGQAVIDELGRISTTYDSGTLRNGGKQRFNVQPLMRQRLAKGVRDLCGNREQRGTVEEGISYTCDKVRRARPKSRETYTRNPGNLPENLCHPSGTAFVARQQNTDIGPSAGVHECSNFTTRQPKYKFYAAFSQRLCYHVCMGQQMCPPAKTFNDFSGEVSSDFRHQSSLEELLLL